MNKLTTRNRCRELNKARRRLAALVVGILTAWGVLVPDAVAEVPTMYAIEFLATGSEGVDMNEQGVAIGTKFFDDPCWPDCLPPQEQGVWVGNRFSALPLKPGWTSVTLEAINDNGWIVGFAFNTQGVRRAIVWKPLSSGNRTRYQTFEIPPLPDTDYSSALGIDNSNRVVGYSDRIFPVNEQPFLWTETGGLVDLTGLGFPDARPDTVSPGGTVGYVDGWYQLDVPGIFHVNAPTPPGFVGPGAVYIRINDTGDQIRLLGPTSGENIRYPFRYYHTGEWQQIWPSGGIDQSPFGVGSINNNLDIALTISNTGLVAPGPAEGALEITSLLSPAYVDSTVWTAEAMTEDGRILGEAAIGNSNRLVRLVPAEPCTTNCMTVSSLEFDAIVIYDPDDPGRCVGTAHTRALARIHVTDETGAPLEGVRVTGRFLDSYWGDEVRRGRTDGSGTLGHFFTGVCGRGSTSFLVTNLEKDGYTFDQVNGELVNWMIPRLP